MNLVKSAIKTVEKQQKEKLKEDKQRAKNESRDPIIKKLPVGFKEEADAMGETSLRNVIVDSTNNIRNIEIELETNSKYLALKDAVKEITEPFNEAKKTQSAKIKYCVKLLKEKGILSDGEVEETK